MLDNVSPKQINMEVFSSLRSINSVDKNSSINIFAKNLNWPYTGVPYGIFKLCDYNNFQGTTIATNLELLEYAKEVPHNNRLVLYCHTFPWVDTKVSLKNTFSLLTNPEIDVYCRVDYIKEFITTFGKQSKTCTIDSLIREILWP